MSEGAECDCGCRCDEVSEYNISSSLLPPFKVTTSEFSVSLKEIIILSMIFLLLLYSILAFLHKWKRNYYDISSSCQFNSRLNNPEGEILRYVRMSECVPVLTFPVPRCPGAPGMGGGGAPQQGGEQDVKNCQGKRQKINNTLTSLM